MKPLIVNWATSYGQIDALESARDRGMHGGLESCMLAGGKVLRVLQWLREVGATWDSRVISCAEEGGYNYVVEWAERMAVLDHKLDQMLYVPAPGMAINSFM